MAPLQHTSSNSVTYTCYVLYLTGGTRASPNLKKHTSLKTVGKMGQLSSEGVALHQKENVPRHGQNRGAGSLLLPLAAWRKDALASPNHPPPRPGGGHRGTREIIGFVHMGKGFYGDHLGIVSTGQRRLRVVSGLRNTHRAQGRAKS